jgi:tripeptide aminopeptidase
MPFRKPGSQTTLPLFDYIDTNIQDFVEDLIRICEVPAPPYAEQKRAAFLANLFRGIGLPASIDEIGNVIIPVTSSGKPHVILSAHLDTVFPFEEIHVTRKGTVLHAPGISDDSSGLAALLYICKAFQNTGLPKQGSLTVVATVGEEGLGNLRGVSHHFSKHRKNIDYFVSLDGCESERLVIVGLGSKRVRIVLRSPGGHSWADAGIPNPIHAAGELLFKINRLTLPKAPKTVINVGIISGGTSINAIPTEVHCDIDLRSESDDQLAALDQFLQRSVNDIAVSNPQIETELQVLGERPSGSISPDHPLVKAAIDANQQFGLSAKTDTGSTDSNIPLALGVPAITLGVGGKCGKIHTPEEWYDVKDVGRGLKRSALLIVDLLLSG